MFGALVGVERSPLGSELAAAVVAGDTVLSVEYAGDFNEDGGSLVLADTTLAYTACDGDAGTITLAGAAGVTAGVSEAVVVLEAGAVAEEWLAHVALNEGDGGDTIVAVIPTALIAYFTEGDYDTPTPIEVESDGDGEYTVLGQPQTPAVLDGTVIDITTMPPAASLPTDAQVPAQVASVGTVGGLGLIFVKWQAVTTNAVGGPQRELVTYDVHVSTDPAFVPGPATKVAETPSTLAAIKYLPDGSPFVYDDPLVGGAELYYFVVIARDVDGAGAASAKAPGSMNRAANGDLSANSVTADTLASVLVLGSTITTRAQVGGQSVGAGIELTPTSLIAYDASGKKVLEVLPGAATGSPAATLRGDAEIDHLTVFTLTTLQESLLSQNATMTLQGAVANPGNQASTSLGYSTLSFADDGKWSTRYGWAVTSDNLNAFTIQKEDPYWWLERYNETTGDRLNRWSLLFTMYDDKVTVVNAPNTANVWVLYHRGGDSPGFWYLDRYDTTTGSTPTISGTWSIGSGWTPPASTAVPISTNNTPTACIDHNGNWQFAWVDSVSGTLKFAQGTPNVSTFYVDLVGSVKDSGYTPGSFNLGSMLAGNANMGSEFGGNRYVTFFRSTNDARVSNAMVWNFTTAARVTNEEWPRDPTRGGANGGWYHAGVGFRVQHYGVVYTYESGNRWTTESDQWWVSYAWTNHPTTPTLTTKLAPPLLITMRKRAQLIVSTPSLPPGVLGVSIYVIRGASAPSTTVANTMHKQAEAPLVALRGVLTISTAVFTPLVSPAASTFGTGTPAKIVSEATDIGGALIRWGGNGGWRLYPLGQHDPASVALVDKFDTAWVEVLAASGITKQMAQYRRIGNIVHLRFRVLTVAAISYTVNGNITGDPALLAALPAVVAPPENEYLAITAGSRGGMGYVGTDGVTHLSAADGYGTASTVAAGGTIAGTATWFI